MTSISKTNGKQKPPAWHGKLELARKYHAYGFNVVPEKAKRPLVVWTPWQTERQTIIDINRMPWRTATGIGAITGPVSGDLVCVDFDEQDGSRAVERFLVGLNVPTPYGWTVQTPGGGYHVWLRAPGLTLPNEVAKLDRPGKAGGHIELRHKGIKATLPPSRHANGKRYQWMHEEPQQAPATVDPALLLAAYDAVTVAPPVEPEREGKPYTVPTNAHEMDRRQRWAADWFNRRLAVLAGTQKGNRNDSLYDLSFLAGQLVGVGLLNGHEVEQALRPVARTLNQHFATVRNGLSDGEKVSPVWVPDFEPRTSQPRGDLLAAPIDEQASATRYPDRLLPYTYVKHLLNAGLHNAALVLHNYQQLDTPDGAPVSLTDLRGNLTRRAVESGADQLETLNIAHFATHTCEGSNVVLQNVPNSRGKPGRQLVFLPLVDQLARSEAFLANVARERRHSEEDAPSDVQPDFAEPALTGAECATLDEARAGVYAAHAEQRARARAALERDLRYLEADFERIRQGRYRPFEMPEGVTNAPQLRKALFQRTLDENPDGIESYKVRRAAGLSRSQACRYRQEHSIVIPQFEDTPVSTPGEIRLGQHQRAELVGQGETLYVDGAEHAHSPEVREFLARHAGAVLRKSKPSIEKRRDRASERELAEYQAYRESKIRAAQAGGGAERGEAKRLLPSGFSTTWLARQLNYTPGVGELARYDAESGEVYTPAQLWHALAEHITSQARGRGESMATFAAHSEPREWDDLPAAQPAQPVAAEHTIDRAASPTHERHERKVQPLFTSPPRPRDPLGAYWFRFDELQRVMGAVGD